MLEVKDLNMTIEGNLILKNVSLKLLNEQVVGILGPNGAGKTSLINCISRVVNSTSGKIIFNETEIQKLSPEKIISMGIARTFQDLNFFSIISSMSILEYMCLGQFVINQGSIFGDSIQNKSSMDSERDIKSRARKILEIFSDIRESLDSTDESKRNQLIYGREGFPDLIDVEHQPISSLSFAWRRRIDLARALVTNPKILLLDEPAQGLPPSEIENLCKFLKIVRGEFKFSAFIIEHNVSALASIADQIVLMGSGQIIMQAEPKIVLNSSEFRDVYFGKAKENIATSKPVEVETPKENKEILRIEDLDLFYGSAQALFGVTMSIKERQITCVLGTNGSGKSTLLKAISGLEKPEFGKIIFDGELIPLGWPELAAKSGIQFVPQGHVFFPQLTVLENLRIGATTMSRTERKKGFELVYEYFPELHKNRNKYAIDLSGGQKQMLVIGQALMAQPKLLLLDEPTLGISPTIADSIFEKIKIICVKQRCSVLLVEQSVAKSIEVSDYIYLMNAGNVVGEGAKDVFVRDSSIVMKNLGFT